MNILIINSRGHWLNGWMTSAESEAAVVRVLKKGGCSVSVVEVASPAELDTVLKNTPNDTLVWANAYWVQGENGEEISLVEQIEKYGLPMVGSGLETLRLLLEKDSCQRKLAAAGIPVPQNTVFRNGDLSRVREQLEQSELVFPLVVKPTKESRSHGVKRVENIDEAVAAIHAVASDYPFGNIIVEEFLPTDDITCGYLKLNDEMIIMPSFNVVKGMDCSQEVFGEKHYQLPPDYEQQVIIEDNDILEQIQAVLPDIVDTLGVRGITRIDGRLDAQGTLKVFDVNGMPGLNYPISALIKQCVSHFPSYSADYLFECLINTIVLENFQRYDMIVPPSMQRNQLFNLESDTILKLKLISEEQKNYVHIGI